MERDNTKMNSGEIKHTIFIVLLAFAIGALILACTVLIRNAEEIKSDPVDYAIKNDFYDSCSCFKEGVGFSNFGAFRIETKEKVIQNRTG